MVAHRHNNRSWLAYFPETTVCSPPADWSVSGVSIEHLGVDVSGVKAKYIGDPTMEQRAKLMGKRARIPGDRNVDWSFRAKLHGVGAETATGNQVAATYLSTLLEWTLGGVHRSYTRAVVSSANAYTLTVGNGLTTGFVVGACVAVEDTTSPAAQYDGKPILRQIASVDGGTHTITLTEALPFTPASGDVIHATITAYVDEDVLEDAVRGGSLHTMNWLHKRTRNDTDTIYQLEATVANLGITNLGKGQLPELVFSCMSANFRHSGEDDLSEPTFSSTVGYPQLSNGPDLLCSIVDASGTTSELMDVREVTFETGIQRTREETTTEVDDRFEGMATYSANFGDAKFGVTISGYTPDWYAGLDASTRYRITLTQPGPGTGAGKGWGIIMPKGQLVATPGLVNGTATLGAQLEFEAMNPALAATEIGTSPFVIAIF